MPEKAISRKRQPLIAGILALIGPGLGHVYGGNIGMATGLVVAAVTFANVFFLLVIHTKTESINLIYALSVGCLGHLLYVLHAWDTARRQPKDYVLRKYNQWYNYVMWWLALVILGLFTGSIFGNYRSYKTPTTSMENALFWSDRFVADMNAYEIAGPARGDIAIFICPCDGTTIYIKRCVAVAGDTVEIVDKKLYVNGVPAKEPSTVQFTDTTSSGEPNIHTRPDQGVDSRDNYGPHVVPVNEYFMIGDNRDNSLDSRYWGFVPKALLLGKAVRIYYSPDWSRIGQLIM